MIPTPRMLNCSFALRALLFYIVLSASVFNSWFCLGGFPYLAGMADVDHPSRWLAGYPFKALRLLYDLCESECLFILYGPAKAGHRAPGRRRGDGRRTLGATAAPKRRLQHQGPLLPTAGSGTHPEMSRIPPTGPRRSLRLWKTAARPPPSAFHSLRSPTTTEEDIHHHPGGRQSRCSPRSSGLVFVDRWTELQGSGQGEFHPAVPRLLTPPKRPHDLNPLRGWGLRESRGDSYRNSAKIQWLPKVPYVLYAEGLRAVHFTCACAVNDDIVGS